jgi:cytoskeletal protein CcmA (bactofilin family)
MAKVQEADPNAINQFVEGTHITGNIECEKSIRIVGSLKGNLNTKGRAVVGKSGKVTGIIHCHNGEIEGTVDGKIIVSDLLSLKSTAVVNGEIVTSKLAIEPGAVLNATCDMSGKQTHQPQQNAPESREKAVK